MSRLYVAAVVRTTETIVMATLQAIATIYPGSFNYMHTELPGPGPLLKIHFLSRLAENIGKQNQRPASAGNPTPGPLA